MILAAWNSEALPKITVALAERVVVQVVTHQIDVIKTAFVDPLVLTSEDSAPNLESSTCSWCFLLRQEPLDQSEGQDDRKEPDTYDDAGQIFCGRPPRRPVKVSDE